MPKRRKYLWCGLAPHTDRGSEKSGISGEYVSEQSHKRTAMLLITEISLWRSVGRVSYTADSFLLLNFSRLLFFGPFLTPLRALAPALIIRLFLAYPAPRGFSL